MLVARLLYRSTTHHKIKPFALALLLAASPALWAANAVLEPVMQLIPAGEFMMGSQQGPIGDGSHNPAEGPAHKVAVPAFKLSKYEITVGQFRQFVQATQYKTESRCWTFTKSDTVIEMVDMAWDSPANAPTEYHPVLCVSWDDANAYAKWLSAQTGQNYRLPSEAEWEYAARAGSTSKYFFGDTATDLCRYANIKDQRGQEWLSALTGKPGKPIACDDGAAFTRVVGQYAPNAFGLYDMIGNVGEWVADCQHADYQGAPADGSAWLEQCQQKEGSLMRIQRGGSYAAGQTGSRLSTRAHGGQDNRSSLGEGFRLAATASKAEIEQCPAASACTLGSKNSAFANGLLQAQRVDKNQ